MADPLQDEIAQAIREACADDADCAAHNNRCLEIHPVHRIETVRGKIVAVEADVDALAAIAARVLRARVAGGMTRVAVVTGDGHITTEEWGSFRIA